MKNNLSRRNFFTNVGKGSLAVIASNELLSCHQKPKNPTFTLALDSTRLQTFTALDSLRPSVSRFSDIHRVIVGDDIIIHALEINLKNELFTSINNLTIYADTITLAENIILPSKNIFLHARKILSNSNITVDVSGNNVMEFDSPASGIAGIGENGNNGENGKRGNNGGKIIMVAEIIEGNLTLKSNGSNGGGGQTGANGGKGRTGATGPDIGCINDRSQSGNPGGKGGQGGSAGIGGRGGDAGNAGEINLYLINKPSDEITFELNGGKGGLFGKNGNVGSGGDGGLGGRATKFIPGRNPTRNSEGREPQCITLNDRPNTGPVGDNGINPPNKDNGNDGLSKVTTNCTTICDYQFIASTSSITQLGLSLHAASIDYLNNNFNSCASYLDWLLKLTEKEQKGNDLVTFRSVSGVTLIDQQIGKSSQLSIAPNLNEWKAVRNRVEVLVAQLKAGLDFYGYPKNYIPLISPEVFQESLVKMFDLSSDIEKGHKLYWNSLGDVNNQLEGIDQTINSSKNALNALEFQIKSIDDKSLTIKNIVVGLDEAIIQLEKELILTSDAFQRAAMRESDGCISFLSIIKLVGAVYLAVQTGGAAAGAIVASVSTLETAKKFADIVAQIKIIASKIGEIKANVEKLKGAYTEFKTEIDQRAVSSKVIMNEDEFKEVFEHFKDLPEAKEYKKILSNYIDTCNTRNNKLFEYTSLIIKRETVKAEVDLQNNQIERLKFTRANTISPNLVEWETFMNIQLGRAKEILIKTIYEASKAFEYWSLSESNIGRIIDLDVAALKSNFLNLISNQLDAKKAQGRNPQDLTNVKILLNSDEKRQDFFKVWNGTTKTLQVRFAITPEIEPFKSHPEWRKILVRKITIKINGLSLKNLSINVVHSGLVKIIDSNVATFSHSPRITNISFDANGTPLTGMDDRNLGGDNKNFVDLSPFTLWTLVIRNGQNIDVKTIKMIEIGFEGSFFAGQA